MSDLRHLLAAHLRDDFLVARIGSRREVPDEAAIVWVGVEHGPGARESSA